MLFAVLRVSSMGSEASWNEVFKSALFLQVRHSTREKKSYPKGFLTTLAFQRLRVDGRTENNTGMVKPILAP